MRHTRLALLLMFLGVCFAQTSQSPATPDELKYLRFMLLNVGSLDHHPDAIKAYEDSLVKLHGLNAQESLAIHTAGQTLYTLRTQQRQLAQSIVANKQLLSDVDRAALANLDIQREQKIADLANQILNSVRAQTAARLRAPGHVMANSVKRN